MLGLEVKALFGYVLSTNLETYLFISVQRYSWSWFSRIGVIVIGAIILISLAMGIFYRGKGKTATKEDPRA